VTLVNKITSTKILELNPEYIVDDEVYLYLELKNFKKYNPFPNYPITGINIISIECFDKIFQAIKNNCDYKYDMYNKIASYKENKLYFSFEIPKDESKIFGSKILPIQINEFNRNNILQKFEKIIGWIADNN